MGRLAAGSWCGESGRMSVDLDTTSAPKRPPGPFSRRVLATIVNGKSTDGHFIRAYQRELTEHIGGRPTIVQRRLIERAAMLALHLLKFDQRAYRVGQLSDRSMRDYLAAHNSLTRTLQAIGVQAAPVEAESKPKTLADIVAEHDSRRGGDSEDDVPP